MVEVETIPCMFCGQESIYARESLTFQALPTIANKTLENRRYPHCVATKTLDVVQPFPQALKIAAMAKSHVLATWTLITRQLFTNQTPKTDKPQTKSCVSYVSFT